MYLARAPRIVQPGLLRMPRPGPGAPSLMGKAVLNFMSHGAERHISPAPQVHFPARLPAAAAGLLAQFPVSLSFIFIQLGNSGLFLYLTSEAVSRLHCTQAGRRGAAPSSGAHPSCVQGYIGPHLLLREDEEPGHHTPPQADPGFHMTSVGPVAAIIPRNIVMFAVSYLPTTLEACKYRLMLFPRLPSVTKDTLLRFLVVIMNKV